MTGRHIRSVEDLLTQLDGLFEALVWDDFYADRDRPHRRISYLSLLERCLKPGGHLGLACFAAGSMGSEVPDAELYRRPEQVADDTRHT